MPNDAKLGLVLGMGLVVLIALVFFRKEPAVAHPPDGHGPGQVSAPKANPPANEKSASPLPAEPPLAPQVNPMDPLIEPPPPLLPGSGG